MVDPDRHWHPEAIPHLVGQILIDLAQQTLLAGFYLAGGTGLAMQLGHRRSRDLDLFAFQAFDPEPFIHKVQGLPGFALTSKAESTLPCTVRGIRVSFLAYPYPLIFPTWILHEVAVADARDIACMKIAAIAGRAAKRDFVDLYAVSQEFAFPHLLDLFRQKFAQANYSLPHILKSLTFFEEAEQDPMPDMLQQVDWGDIKRFFQNEVPKLLQLRVTHNSQPTTDNCYNPTRCARSSPPSPSSTVSGLRRIWLDWSSNLLPA